MGYKTQSGGYKYYDYEKTGYIRQLGGYKYYHYKIGDRITVRQPYTKRILVNPYGEQYIEVKKKVKKE